MMVELAGPGMMIVGRLEAQQVQMTPIPESGGTLAGAAATEVDYSLTVTGLRPGTESGQGRNVCPI
jgi:hypothetical protein